jgi:hypothetical protein
MGAYVWFLTERGVHSFVLLVMIAATGFLPFLAQLGFVRKGL